MIFTKKSVYIVLSVNVSNECYTLFVNIIEYNIRAHRRRTMYYIEIARRKIDLKKKKEKKEK